VADKGGVLYGTTYKGGPANSGTVYSLTPPTSPGGAWTESVLYAFGNPPDGSEPYSNLTIGSGGVLYGTTISGGTASQGTVFSLTPPASPGGAWTEAVLHSFQGYPDGAYCYGGVLIGAGGVIYGATLNGGTSNGGVLYSLTPPVTPGGGWTEAVLHDIAEFPVAGLVMDGEGVLYGTGGEGTFGSGTVFSLTPPASPAASWSEAILQSFGFGSGGSGPYGGVAIGKGGVLYGTTEYGGSVRDGGGTVFALHPPASPGGSWTLRTLYRFPSSAGSTASLLIGPGGVLYGTTRIGGAFQLYGTVFSLTPPAMPGGTWTEAVLHSFSGSDGANPEAGVVIGKDGLLYGTTPNGGAGGYGVVYSLQP